MGTTAADGCRTLIENLASRLSESWPHTDFHVGSGFQTIQVSWCDGPGRRAVLNELRMAGAGTRAIQTNRALTPAVQLTMILTGVQAADAANTDAPDVCEAAPELLRILPARWSDASRMLRAFSDLAPDELEIAVVLVTESPASDPRVVATMARALARPRRSA